MKLSKIMNIVLLGFIINNISASTQPAFDYKTYVRQALIQLFYPFNDAVGYESIEKIRKNDSIAYDDIMEIEVMSNRELNRYSSLQDVSNVVYKNVVTYISKIAYEKAISLEGINIERAIVIADSIKAELNQIYQSASFSKRGCFKGFVGTALEKKVEINAWRLALHTVIASNECARCHEDFNKVPRIFLSCGHDLCVSCARQISDYFSMHCFRCNKSIDLKKLRNQLSK